VREWQPTSATIPRRELQGDRLMHTIGIRREDKDQWEARVPLTPDHVGRLITSHSLQIALQPSRLRVFPADDYERVGARIDDDLSACDIVLAVKEIPRDLFLPGKTYVFFSHTIKGQPYNMAMLRRLMELECQLIDYERITDERFRRLIFFSRFAGLAGAIDSLWALGRRLDWEGLTPNPFSALSPTYRYATLASALKAVEDAGLRLAADGLPEELCPFVIGITGYGNVSRGAQEVIDALGARHVSPADLDDLVAAEPERHAAYKAVFAEEDLVARRDGGAFVLDDYYQHPDLYGGRFEARLPQLAVLINCIYWDTPYPRLVTRGAARRLFAGAARPRLRVIGDLSCDIEGSIELTVKETHIDNPVYVYEPATDTISDGVAGPGPVVLAVGNLPCELSREASEAFSTALLPLVPALAAADLTRSFADVELPPELRRATILHRGAFTPSYAYMERFV